RPDGRRSHGGPAGGILPRHRTVRGLFAPGLPARPAPYGDGRPGTLRADPHRAILAAGMDGGPRTRLGPRAPDQADVSGLRLPSAALDSGTGCVERAALAAAPLDRAGRRDRRRRGAPVVQLTAPRYAAAVHEPLVQVCRAGGARAHPDVGRPALLPDQ